MLIFELACEVWGSAKRIFHKRIQNVYLFMRGRSVSWTLGRPVPGFVAFYFVAAGVVGVLPAESHLLVGTEYVNPGALGQS